MKILGISPKDLINDLESFGLFFEDFAIRDLRIYANYLGGEVKHYRDNTGLECDAIIILEDGRWGAIETLILGLKPEVMKIYCLRQLLSKTSRFKDFPTSQHYNPEKTERKIFFVWNKIFANFAS